MNLRRTSGLAAIALLAFGGAARAQGWGEQVPLRFGIAGPGGNLMAAEITRRQLMYNNANVAIGIFSSTMNACAVTGACGIGGGGGGGGGGGSLTGVNGSTQLSTPSMNSTTNNPVLNVTINGSNNGPVTVSNPTQGGLSGVKQSADGSSIGSSNTQSTGGNPMSASGLGAQNTLNATRPSSHFLNPMQ